MLNEKCFTWVNKKKLEGIPPQNLLRLVAKTTAPTFHPEEAHPKRIFSPQELALASRSLIGKSLGLNHSAEIDGAKVLDAEWNAETMQVEAIAQAPAEFVMRVAEGKIKTDSVEFGWRNIKETAEGDLFEGLFFNRVDLVEGLEAGDPNATVHLYEASSGGFTGEVSLFEAEPEKVEKKLYDETAAKLMEAEKRIGELEPAVTKLQENATRSIAEKKLAVETAVKEARQEFCDKVEEVLPKAVLMRNGISGLHIFTQNVKRVLKEAREQ